MNEKDLATSEIGRRIVSEEDKSTKNEDDVSGRKRRLQLTRVKRTAWYTTIEDHGVQKAKMLEEVDEESQAARYWREDATASTRRSHITGTMCDYEEAKTTAILMGRKKGKRRSGKRF